MIRACLFLLLGGIAAQHIKFLLPSNQLVLILAVACVCLFVIRTRSFAYLLFGLVFFVVAVTSALDRRIDRQYEGDSVLTEVVIVDFPMVREQSVSFIVSALDDVRLPPRSRVTWTQAPVIPAMGDIWQLELRLKAPRGLSNPGGFDVETFMLRAHIGATGYVVSGKRNQHIGYATMGPIADLRMKVVDAAVDNSRNDAAVALYVALAVGTRHLLNSSQWEQFAATGTSHLMAISGLHIGLAAGFFVFVFRLLAALLRLPGNHRVQSLIAGLVGATTYALLSGWGIPAQRAVVMLAITLVAILQRRRIVLVNILLLTAAIIYISEPLSLLAPGFRLSFLAVALLILFAQQWPGFGGNRLVQRVRRGALRLLALQGALLFGLLPVTLGEFGRVALLAPLANVLLLPYFSFVVVPLTLISLVAVSFDAAGAAVILAVGSIEFVLPVLDWLARLEVASLVPAALSPFTGIALVVAVSWVFLPKGWPARHVAFIALLLICTNRPDGAPSSCVTVQVLDVGQGLAIVVQSPERVLVFDTGAKYFGGGSAADQVLKPYLRRRGIQHIDWVFVSHGDNDHAGGLSDLTAEFSVGRLLLGEPQRSTGMNGAQCLRGQVFRMGAAMITVLHPDEEWLAAKIRTSNDQSCVVELRIGEHRLLLTGDIEAAAERHLVGESDLEPATIVIVPHHGSQTSSSSGFVDRVAGNLAIAATAFDNRWGFPKPLVVDRWQAAGSRFLNTGESGAIGATLCAGEPLIDIREERQEQRRFWHR